MARTNENSRRRSERPENASRPRAEGGAERRRSQVGLTGPLAPELLYFVDVANVSDMLRCVCRLLQCPRWSGADQVVVTVAYHVLQISCSTSRASAED